MGEIRLRTWEAVISGTNLLKTSSHPRTDGNMAIILCQRHAATHAPNFNVLQDVMVLLRTVVEFKTGSGPASPQTW